MSDLPPELSPAVVRAQRGVPLASSRSSPRVTTRRTASHLSVVTDTALTEDERAQIVDTFVELLEGLYTHLPLKRARYAIDPVQRLRLLRQRVAAIDDDEMHAEIAATMTSLRDAHTRYIGPTALEGHVAALPFLVEAYGPPGQRRYIVSKIARTARPFSDTHFQAGVEIEHWNAVPIDRAVELHAEHETGGRPSARRSRALESLTFRGLQYLQPPDEDWVVIGYRDRQGRRREVRFDWRVVTPERAETAVRPDTPARRAVAADPAAEMARRVKKLLFAPELWASERLERPAARMAPAVAAKADEWIPTDFHDVVGAKAVRTRHGRFGYLRLWSFDVGDHTAYVDEVVRLLDLLPDRGLVIDLRSNPGGLVWAAERLLQLFTPHPVAPTNFSMVATALTRAMVQAPQNDVELERWRASVDDALTTGDVYSHAVPLTPPGAEPGQANDLGQRYGGPVVAVVDANTYSSGDLFAAGFVDNCIGVLVGVDDASGGGGANVWEPGDVARALAGTPFERAGSLPGGVGYTIAVRRATRSGVAEGAAIEDVGVRAHEHYVTTKRDLTGGNRGLIDFCGALLRDQPYRRLHVERRAHDLLAVTAAGIDRLDVAVDGRPKESLDVTDGRPVMVSVPLEGAVDLKGFAGGQLVQRRLLRH